MRLCVIAVVVLAGCTSVPTWSDATPQQRSTGFFKADGAYMVSPQHEADMQKSMDAVKRLRMERYGHE